MKNPLISVILPVYNIKPYLPKCMESVISQTWQNLEIILVDDGSYDGSEDLCDGYARADERIVVYHKKNGGLSDARNYGIARAKGLYITCVDADDHIDSDYVEYLAGLILKHKTKMSICQHRVYYDNGSVKDFGKKGEEVLTAERTLERMLYHDVVDTSAWAKLYHRDLFRKVHYPKGRIFEDIGTTYALMMQCDKIAVGYESKYNYIYHENSIVNSAFIPQKMDLLDMTDHMGMHVNERFPRLYNAVMRRRVYARFSTLNQMLRASECEEERAEVVEFIKLSSKEVLRNPKTPRRDRVAIRLLNLSYPLYRFVWLRHRERLMGR